MSDAGKSTRTAASRQKQVRPKRELGKVLASVRQVIRVQHVAETEAIWTWGAADLKGLPTEFNLCIWNLWKQSGGENFKAEFRALMNQSELFLGQEALLSRDAIALFAWPSRETIHAATYRRMDGKRDGVITISVAKTAFPPKRVISVTAEPVLKTTKAALLTYYRSDPLPQTSSVAVVNFHSTLIRMPRTAKAEILRIIENLENHDGPIIFAGDFNTFSRQHFIEMEKALNIIGVRHIAPKNEPRRRLARLDQLFLRGFEVLEFTIDTSFKHSDHFPIVCRLRFAKA